MCETFPASLERGAGLPAVERLGYLAEFTMAQLAGARHLVLVDAAAPVSFFAYPDMPGYLVPDGLRGARAGRRRDGDDAAGRSGGAGRHPRGAGRRCRPPGGGAARAPDRGAHGRVGQRRHRRPAPRRGRRVRRGQHLGHLHPRGHRRRARPRLALSHRRGHRPGHAGGHRARPWPAPVAGSSPSRPTAVPCTRCRPCGPRRARASTSPP